MGTDIESISRDLLFGLLVKDKPWLIRADFNVMEIVKIEGSFVIIFHLHHGRGETIYRVTYTASTNTMLVKHFELGRKTEIYSPFIRPQFLPEVEHASSD